MACFWSLPEAVRAREGANVTPTGHYAGAGHQDLTSLPYQAVRERDRVDARVQFVQGAAQVAPGQLNALRVPVVPEV
jgi:hypothetical protein